MADYAIFGVTIADVAQLDRAFGYEPKGSRFESWHPQKGKVNRQDWPFLFFVESRRETGAAVSELCEREDMPKLMFSAQLGISGLYTAPGSSPGTRRKEDVSRQVRRLSFFVESRRETGAVVSLHGMTVAGNRGRLRQLLFSI